MDGFRQMGNRSRSGIVSLAYSPIGHPLRRIAYRHSPYDWHWTLPLNWRLWGHAHPTKAVRLALQLHRMFGQIVGHAGGTGLHPAFALAPASWTDLAVFLGELQGFHDPQHLVHIPPQ